MIAPKLTSGSKISGGEKTIRIITKCICEVGKSISGL